jgi:hypothetical protein
MTVLRPAVFGCVHIGHDFDASHDRFFDMVWNRHNGLQFAVYAITDTHFRHVWLEMDIAGVGVDGAH